MELLSNWIENGGSPTLKALTECKPELIEDIIEYLKDIPVYDMVSVGGQDFFLSHSGLANFEILVMFQYSRKRIFVFMNWLYGSLKFQST